MHCSQVFWRLQWGRAASWVPRSSAPLYAKSAPSAPHAAIALGVNRDHVRQQEGFVFVHCFCQVQCQQGLCSHPSQLQEQSQLWLPLHNWNRRAGEPAARLCNPSFWPHYLRKPLCSDSSYPRDTRRVCQLGSRRLQCLLPSPLWTKPECVAGMGSFNFIPNDAEPNEKLSCTITTAFVCLVTSCFGQQSGWSTWLWRCTAVHCAL